MKEATVRKIERRTILVTSVIGFLWVMFCWVMPMIFNMTDDVAMWSGFLLVVATTIAGLDFGLRFYAKITREKNEKVDSNQS